jgi:hypothetical protein
MKNYVSSWVDMLKGGGDTNLHYDRTIPPPLFFTTMWSMYNNLKIFTC